MRLGAIPLAAQIVISIQAWMLKRDIDARTAALYAAAEFDYYKQVSDAELTALAFQMAKDYPQYPYYEWFRILQDISEYGGSVPGPEPAELPPGELPDRDADDKKPTSYTWLLVALGIIAFVLITEG